MLNVPMWVVEQESVPPTSGMVGWLGDCMVARCFIGTWIVPEISGSGCVQLRTFYQPQQIYQFFPERSDLVHFSVL